jgi:anthranilate synthase component 1/para-aminobenzoate synthetase
VAPSAAALVPSVILLDGRSGAGKTSLAVELAAALREHRTVTLIHLEDLYPGWDGLAEGIGRCAARVLGPLRRGGEARWRPWDWVRGAEGPERVSEAAEVVILEGVGAGAAPLRALADAVVWVDAPAEERRRRALARDGDVYAPHWDRWAAQEEAWLAHDDVPAAAAVTVASPSGADRPEGLADRVLAALAGLPPLWGLLAPERSERESAPVVVRRLGAAPDPERLFRELFGASAAAVWLDSSDAEVTPGNRQATPRNRFSIMADDGGLLGRRMAHRRGRTEVVHGPTTDAPVSVRSGAPFFRWLDAAWGHGQADPVPGLGCGFGLGWLGYLGYELKRECGGSDVDPGVPDAQLVFAARAVVLDHAAGEVWLLALDAADAPSWLDRAEAAVRERPSAGEQRGVSPETLPSSSHAVTSAGPAFTARETAAEYRDKVRAAQAEIAEGNTYEACLTTTLEAAVPAHGDRPGVVPLDVYTALRRRSPAPFAAFARFGPLAIASTSPERFLALAADGALRAEPIKGTRRRSPGASPEDAAADERVRAELAANPKDRAENLMIVDLLRNDLSHHAVPGSVRVSRLFAVETYATVHQLVSTVDARLRPGASRAEAVAAAFPPGSMTGAPKISTMAILDRLEAGPRGVYSGVIGYFSRTGAADLSVVIRTLVMETADDAATRLTLGVGGAVVADSDPAAEHDEIRAKAFAVLSALGSEFPED